MRLVLLTFSIAFAVYGLLPYKKAKDIDTTKSNQLIIDHQECGCPCPDAEVIEGRLEIPNSIASIYQTISTSQINLDFKDFNDPYNYELGGAALFVKGEVVGADTILCEPNKCELAPRFQVHSWALVNTVARAWTFPSWAGFLFLINLLLLLPALTISVVTKRVRKNR